jgi:hypothetical protein
MTPYGAGHVHTPACATQSVGDSAASLDASPGYGKQISAPQPADPAGGAQRRASAAHAIGPASTTAAGTQLPPSGIDPLNVKCTPGPHEVSIGASDVHVPIDA